MSFDFTFKQLKSGFFDTEAVKKLAASCERKTLSKFGAFSQRRMKSSLKYAKGKSKPGRPPHVHTSNGFTRQKKSKKTGETKRQVVSPLREFLYFAYDASKHSTVVGPAKFGGSGGVAPPLLEGGGVGYFKASRTGELKRGVYAPRPFVEPAGRAEIEAGKYLTPG